MLVFERSLCLMLERCPYQRDVCIKEMFYWIVSCIREMCMYQRCLYQRGFCIRNISVLESSLYQRDVWYQRDACIRELCILQRCLHDRDVCIRKMSVWLCIKTGLQRCVVSREKTYGIITVLLIAERLQLIYIGCPHRDRGLEKHVQGPKSSNSGSKKQSMLST